MHEKVVHIPNFLNSQWILKYKLNRFIKIDDKIKSLQTYIIMMYVIFIYIWNVSPSVWNVTYVQNIC